MVKQRLTSDQALAKLRKINRGYKEMKSEIKVETVLLTNRNQKDCKIKYCEQFYTDNLDKVEKLRETRKLSKLIQEEIK